MLAGDAELLEPQRAGLEQPLEIAAYSLLQLGGVHLHPLPDAVQELHHAYLGCAKEFQSISPQRTAEEPRIRRKVTK